MRAYFKQGSGHTWSEATTDFAKLRQVTTNWRISLPFYELSEVHEVKKGIGPYLERSDHRLCQTLAGHHKLAGIVTLL